LVRHGRFHTALVGACGLVWFMRFRDSLYEQSERYRQLALPIDPAARDVAAEHRAIVEAALEGDADTAVAALARHIERTATAIAEAYHRREDAGAAQNVPSMSG
jgi:GntR family transcriptional regulator, carbon starvation induced regulator